MPLGQCVSAWPHKPHEVAKITTSIARRLGRPRITKLLTYSKQSRVTQLLECMQTLVVELSAEYWHSLSGACSRLMRIGLGIHEQERLRARLGKVTIASNHV